MNKSQEFLIKSPSFQCYPSDVFSDIKVMAMSAEQFGAYWRLILMCWGELSLPDDLEVLAAIAKLPLKKFKLYWDKKIKRCFIQNEQGEWIHPRLEEERENQENNRKVRSEAGTLGNEIRWGKSKKQRIHKNKKVALRSDCDEKKEINPNSEIAERSQCDDFAIAKNRLTSSSSSSISNTKNSECVQDIPPDLFPDEKELPLHTRGDFLKYFQQKHVEKTKRQTNLYDLHSLMPKLHGLMKTHGADVLYQLVDSFFAEDRSRADKWLQNADYSFNVFASQAERLAQSASVSMLSAEEMAKQVDAIIAQERGKNDQSRMH